MKRPFPLLLAGLIAGGVAFGAMFWLQTRGHHSLSAAPGSELEWLRQEFRLNDAQFARVSALHQAYRPTCADLCRRIAERNERLRAAVARTNVVTEEIRTLVTETGRARDDCRQAMLTHLYAVAAEMPPEAGQRYLQIMLGATCVLQETRSIDAVQPGAGAAASHGHHD